MSLLLLFVLACNLFSSPVPPIDSSCGLVAYYPFNGNANDQSVNANNGMVYGAKLSTDRFFDGDRAYQFDGLENFIDIGDSTTLKMTEGLTISVWVKPETFEPIYQNIVSDHSINELEVGSGKILRLNHNEIQFHIGGVFGIETAIYVKFPLDSSALSSWHHIAGTYDRHLVNLFVDGVKVDSREYTEAISVNENHILIGKSGFGEYFKGNIDDLGFYNRAFAEDEIRRLYTDSHWIDGC